MIIIMTVTTTTMMMIMLMLMNQAEWGCSGFTLTYWLIVPRKDPRSCFDHLNCVHPQATLKTQMGQNATSWGLVHPHFDQPHSNHLCYHTYCYCWHFDQPHSNHCHRSCHGYCHCWHFEQPKSSHRHLCYAATSISDGVFSYQQQSFVS